MKRKFHLTLSSLLLVPLVLAGCGGSATSGGGASSPSGDSAAGGGKILIATQTPLSGSQSAVGEAIKLGAEMALNEHKEEFKKLGFDLQLFPQDDQADPKQGVANAELLVSNPDVLAVVGHYNTGVSIPASVKYEQASLVMVSPSNTAIMLTEEGKKTVHRICARDDQEGPKGAQYAKNQLGVKTAFVIHDKTTYGQGLAELVKAQFEKDGVKVLGFEGVTPGEKDYSPVVNQALAANPDLIYFGGMYPEAGILAKQAREKNYKGIIMGGAGLDAADFVKIAGPAAEGVYFTSVVGDMSATEEGKKWVEEYEKQTGKKPEGFAAYGYDSMLVVLNGLKKAIEANGGKKPTREQVLEAVHNTTGFQGKFTKVSFDEKGDNQDAEIYIYKFENGKAVFIGKAS